MQRDFLRWCLQQTPVPPSKLAAQRPDFLVISPPKTGSTWLADNLRCHPDVFVPPNKEVKYFSSWYRHLDLNWYLGQFVGGVGRIKGEASPSYALLPRERIRLVRRLLPDIKLVFLMRDPVARAWSHAKHCFRYREANFAASSADFAAVTDAEWRANFRHEWTLASGDYLGQLRRWRSVFPRGQMYVGFYESIARAPETLLRELFAFLEVSPEVDFARFPVADRILPGLPASLPAGLREDLHDLLGNRTRELADFLAEEFDLQPPPDWEATLPPLDRAQAYRPPSPGGAIVSSQDRKPLDRGRRIPTSPGGVAETHCRPSGDIRPVPFADQGLTPLATDCRCSAAQLDVDGGPGNGLATESEPTEVFNHEFDDIFLARLLALEESFPSSALLAVEGYHGYSLARYRGRWHAIDQTLGTVHLPELSDEDVARYRSEARLFDYPSVNEARERIDQHLVSQLPHQFQAIARLRSELVDAWERIACLEHDLRAYANEPYCPGDGREALANTILKVIAREIPLYRWHVWTFRVLRMIWYSIRLRG
jgi:hypothetical protein